VTSVHTFSSDFPTLQHSSISSIVQASKMVSTAQDNAIFKRTFDDEQPEHALSCVMTAFGGALCPLTSKLELHKHQQHDAGIKHRAHPAGQTQYS
jgi:hypothetical protein